MKIYSLKSNGYLNATRNFSLAVTLTIAFAAVTAAQTNTFPNSGSAGIGTTTPTESLEINKNQNAGTTLAIDNGYTSSGNAAYSGFWFRQAAANRFFFGSINDGNTTQNGGPGAVQFWNFINGPMLFATNNSERMRIDGNGNVGIGTTNPAVTLHVAAGNADAITRVAQFYQPGLSTNNNYAFVSVGKANVADQAAAFGFLMNTAGNDSAFVTVAGDDPSVGTGLFVKKGGNVGIGTSNPQYKLDVNGNTNVTGNITATGSIAAKYQDVAEWVPSSQQLAAGTVVVLDSTRSNEVIASTQPYDTRVAGVISAQPGITLGEKSDTRVLVATTGRVRVKVDASRAPISIGDLLVTSDIPGVAMKSEAVNLGGVQIHRPGTIIGKALEPLAKGSGEILVLLSLQ